MTDKREQPDFDLLIISPDDAAMAKLRESWSWLLEEPWQPVLFTAFGNMFFEGREGRIFWLCTGDGSVTQVAEALNISRDCLKPRKPISGSCLTWSNP